MTEGAAREWCGGIGNARDIRIAQQGQNRMIERRGRQFDLAAGRSFLIDRKHLRQQLKLFRTQRVFVLFRIVLPSRGEVANNRVFLEPKLVHPCEL